MEIKAAILLSPSKFGYSGRSSFRASVTELTTGWSPRASIAMYVRLRCSSQERLQFWKDGAETIYKLNSGFSCQPSYCRHVLMKPGGQE